MQRSTRIPRFFIQLFGEGGGAGAGAAGGAPAGAESAAPAQPQQGVKQNPLADVRYGKQEGASDAGAQQVGKPAGDDRTAQFEALIKGEYKDLYDQRVQDTIQKRLKGQAETVNRYNALSPVLEMLGQKYGVDANDAEALSKAIEEDSSFYEDEAIERGMSVEQLKEIKKMERENRELKAQMDRERNQQQVDQILMKWHEDSENLKTVYPDFDFDREMQTNEQFSRLLQSNIDVRTAYEVTHLNDIIPAAMNFTAQKVEEKVTNKIRAGQNRPQEGAMGNRSPVVVKSDPSKYTKADMQEIFRRVGNGERIIL